MVTIPISAYEYVPVFLIAGYYLRLPVTDRQLQNLRNHMWRRGRPLRPLVTFMDIYGWE